MTHKGNVYVKVYVVLYSLLGLAVAGKGYI